MTGAREGRGGWSWVAVVIEGRDMEFFGMLGRRQGTPMWVDDTVEEAAKDDDWEEGHRTAGGEDGAGPISKPRNNKLRSLGPEWSMSKVGTPLHHNSDKPHVLVASNNNNNNNNIYHYTTISLPTVFQNKSHISFACSGITTTLKVDSGSPHLRDGVLRTCNSRVVTEFLRDCFHKIICYHTRLNITPCPLNMIFNEILIILVLQSTRRGICRTSCGTFNTLKMESGNLLTISTFVL